MHLLITTLFIICSLLLALFVFVSRLALGRGRFAVRGAKNDLPYFTEMIEPKLGLSEERAQWTFPVLVQATISLQGFLLAAWNMGQPFDWETLLQQAAILLLNVILFGQVIPYVLLTHTDGRWLVHSLGILRASILASMPLVAISQFLHHIATLGGPAEEDREPATATENIEALIEAGEEEGLIEKDDRRLIQSVVEFGDKTVRDVMTPRPEIIAVPHRTTLSDLRQILAEHRFTRLPVYEQDIDHIIGFIHAGDLFAVAEDEHSERTVQQLLRSVPFVPETKRISELLQDLQTGSQMAIVVDEYGSVAGLATVEDMVEEIVGEIRDEHDEMDVLPRGENSWSVPGGLSLDRLQGLFDITLGEAGEASTVAGLITHTLGRVPATGETLERDGLRYRITESNGRRITRLDVSSLAIPQGDGQGTLFETQSGGDTAPRSTEDSAGMH
ncbi:MAG: HlyC/CorC family transporter [Acidobacteria bacterium]|nr:HlyC/CorC family transporter [Acidobacteriota bacterium]